MFRVGVCVWVGAQLCASVCVWAARRSLQFNHAVLMEGRPLYRRPLTQNGFGMNAASEGSSFDRGITSLEEFIAREVPVEDEDTWVSCGARVDELTRWSTALA